MAKRGRKRKVRAILMERAPKKAKRRGRGPQKTATVGTRVDMLEQQITDILGKPSLAARVEMLETHVSSLQGMGNDVQEVLGRIQQEIDKLDGMLAKRTGVQQHEPMRHSTQAETMQTQNGPEPVSHEAA